MLAPGEFWDTSSGKMTFPKDSNFAMFINLIFLILSTVKTTGEQVDYLQIPAAFGVQSTYSTGALTLQELAAEAREKKIKAIIMGDHHQIAFTYGFPPFRNLLRIKRQRPSVVSQGLDTYLKEIRTLNREQQEVVIIPGLELLTHYYWQGSPFNKTLSLYNVKMDMHVIGLPRDEDYRYLPVIDGSPSLRYTARLLPQSLPWLAMGLLGLFLALKRKKHPIIAIFIFLFALLGLINFHPFQSSLYDAYHGDPGLAPYQEVIDYVQQRGGIVTWAGPEIRSRERIVEGIRVAQTPPHLQVLEKTTGFTGFEALYGDRRTAHQAGAIWDKLLLAYLQGELENPVWAVGSIDFHKTAVSPWFQLDGAQTVFLAEEISAEKILDAFKKGRMYAVYQGGDSRISLDDFSVTGRLPAESAVQGEVLKTAGKVTISFAVSLQQPARGKGTKVSWQLIRSGRIIRQSSDEIPVKVEYYDDFSDWNKKVFYRLLVKSGQYEIISNPVFVILE